MPKTPTPRVPTFPPADCTEPSHHKADFLANQAAQEAADIATRQPETPEEHINASESANDLPHVATIDLIDVAPSAVIERRVKLTDTAMVIDPESTFEECVSLYDFTHTIRERGRWWLGDIVNFMEDHFPEKYSQAIDLSGLSYSRLTTICSVCRRIDPARRRQDASFTWHEKVAYLPPQSADYLLDRGIKEKWTNEQFEDSVARAKGEPTKAEKRAAKESKPGSTAAKVAASGKTPQVPEGEKPLIWNGYPLRVAITNNGWRIILQGSEVLTAYEAERAAHFHKFAHGPALAAWLEEHNFIEPEGGDEPCETLNVPIETTQSGATIHTAQPTAGPSVSSNGAAPNATESAPTPQPFSLGPEADEELHILLRGPDGPEAIRKLIADREEARSMIAKLTAPAAPPAGPDTPKATETPLQACERHIQAFNEASKAVDWAEVGRNALRRVKWLGAEGSPGLLNRPDEIIDILQKNPPTPRK